LLIFDLTYDISTFHVKNWMPKRVFQLIRVGRGDAGRTDHGSTAGKTDPRFAVGKAWKPRMTPSLQYIDFIENSERPTE
jgi:hypothetical protein